MKFVIGIILLSFLVTIVYSYEESESDKPLVRVKRLEKKSVKHYHKPRVETTRKVSVNKIHDKFNQPQRGNFDKPGRGKFNQPGRGNFDQPGRGNFDQPGRGNFDQPGRGKVELDSIHMNQNRNQNREHFKPDVKVSELTTNSIHRSERKHHLAATPQSTGKAHHRSKPDNHAANTGIKKKAGHKGMSKGGRQHRKSEKWERMRRKYSINRQTHKKSMAQYAGRGDTREIWNKRKSSQHKKKFRERLTE